MYGGDVSGSVHIAEQLLSLAKQQLGETQDQLKRSKRAYTFTRVGSL